MIITASKLFSPLSNISAPDDCAMVVRGDTILTLGAKDSILKRYASHKVYHFKNAVLMPGLINLHTHLELPPLLDAIWATTFPDWVINLIKAKKTLSNKDYASAAAENIETLIQTGTTTVGEICTHGVSPAFLKKVGLRAVVFQEIIGMESRNLKLKTQNSKLIINGISPHSPYTVSESVLLQINRIAQQKKLRLAMHVAESKDEIRLLQGKKSGFEKLYQIAGWDTAWAPRASSSFEYLHKLGLLGPDFLAVHAVQVTDNDVNLIKKSRVPIAHCPRSNKETGVGRMPLKKFLDAGITVGLGTDSLASSPSLNMWDEMRYAYQTHRRDGVTAQDIFRMATMGGAKALGMENEIGTLEPGKKADIIAVPLPQKNTGNIYNDLLRETKSCIMSVVNGKIIWCEPTASAS